MSENQSLVAEQFDSPTQEEEAASLGMWVFIATEVLFFGVLFTAYVISRVSYPEGFAVANRHTDFLLGTIETGVLLSSSLTMALAVRSAQLGGRRVVSGFLALTVLLGLAFLGIHAVEYYHEYHEGLVPGLNFTYAEEHAQSVELFFFLYYVMTGFHALHVTLGITVLAGIGILAWRGWFSAEYYTPVEISGLYWHLVDIVWIFLYPVFYLVARV